MKCKAPVFLQDKTTGGTMYVPCGRCICCRVNKSREWALRCVHEARSWEQSCFVTLTYDDDHLPAGNTLVKRDLQLFFKRLRKEVSPQKLKYFAAGEYGDNGKRPHYHAVIFGLPVDSGALLEKVWPFGFVYCGSVTSDSANYVAAYTRKKLSGDLKLDYSRRGVIPEFALISQGIGKDYFNRNSKFLRDNQFCVLNGKKVPLPRYYRDRLFNDLEKAVIHQMRQEFYDEDFQKQKLKFVCSQDFEVQKFDMAERKQGAENLEKFGKMYRRKL